MQISKIFFQLFVLTAMTACTMNAREAETMWSSTSNKPLNDAASCIVKALDAEFHSSLGLGATITHSIQIKEVGKVLEVSPQRMLVQGGEIYFVRLTAQGDRATFVEVVSAPTLWKDRVQRPVSTCI